MTPKRARVFLGSLLLVWGFLGLTVVNWKNPTDLGLLLVFVALSFLGFIMHEYG